MRTYRAIIMLLLLTCGLSGCGKGKAEVEAYLRELTASAQTMTELGDQLTKATSDLKQQIAAGQFDAEKTKSVTQGYLDKMTAEADRFAQVTVPERCRELHEATMEQYRAGLEVLTHAIAMVDISKKLWDLSQQAGKDAKKLVALQPEVSRLEEEMKARQQSLAEVAKKGQEADTRAKAERKKLEDEFRIPPAPSTPVAPSSPPG
jgi:hypothetical protein